MKRIILGLPLLIYFIAWAAITTITSSGNWSNSGIWSGGDIGNVVTDDVTFNNTLGTITIQNSESFTVGDVDMGNDNTLTINSSGTLTLGASGNAKDLVTGNASTINVDGDVEIWGDLIVTNDLVINVTGILTIHGNVNMGNGGALDISGDVSVGGDFIGGNGTMVNVDGNLDVTGNIDAGNGSELTGTGTVTSGGCTGDPDFCSGGPLPIILAYFNGRAKSNSIELNWTTTSEEKFDYFEVQKSINASDFHAIGKVHSQGSETHSFNYSFVDEKPWKGLNYYRLKAVDLDGTFEIFDVMGIDFNTESIPIVIYPNPTFTNSFTVENYDQEQNINLELITSKGYSILKSTLYFGKNEFNANNKLSTGIYFLRIDYQGKIHTRVLIIN